MAWWREARFGMFIHWGLYAIAAGEWNGEAVNGAGEWIMDTAKITPAEYEKLAARFNPVGFDATEWARIAEDAGMKYVVITTKHHDGFCLFDSKHTAYDVMDATPFKRDIMKELSEAVRSRGLRMCWYHSIMDWHHPEARGDAFPAYEEVMRSQVRELLTNYGPIGVMWFDGEWISEWTTERGNRLYELCRQAQPGVIINNRVGKGRQGMQGLTAEGDHPGDFGTPEQEVPETGLPGIDWESCMTMNDTWGFKTSDLNWKSADTLIDTLVDVVSKGGNFLLNVGPTAEGRIPEASIERLAAMGRWLRMNGEAIYSAGPSPFRDLAGAKCTTRPGALYIHIPVGTSAVELPGLMNEITAASLLGDPSVAVSILRTGRAVEVRLPPGGNAGPGPRVVRLSIAGAPAVVQPPDPAAEPDPEGTIVLAAPAATIRGESARYEAGPGRECIGFWTRVEDEVAWPVGGIGAGPYRVVLEYACAAGQEGSVVRVGHGATELEFTVTSTGGWGRFRRAELGVIAMADGSDREIRVKPVSIPKGAVMNLRSLRLLPAGAR
ncbi:MAG: alpha-L-fucosidase [Phycisphaerales bacterium]|nr:alpha-L-fucosidase [Phycisphaerales bacterium]